MDECESLQALPKQSAISSKRQPLVSAISSKRQPLVSADNKNGVPRQARAREASPRYRSPSPSTATVPKHSPTPNASRLSPISTAKAAKRAASTERKHPSRPSSPPTPSTPIETTSVDMLLRSRKPVSLWPSTMRSLNVSFQSDTISIPTSKREKPVSHVNSDRTLRLSSSVAHRQGEISGSRKCIPERKRSPPKGKNSANQSENSKPDDSLRHRLVDQHRWPSRTNGKLSTAFNRSINPSEKTRPPSPVSRSRPVTPLLRKSSLDGTVKPLPRVSSDLLTLIFRDENGKTMSSPCSDDASSSSSDGTQLSNATARVLCFPTPGSHPASPSVSRGVSPTRVKAVNYSSRGPSPASMRTSSPSRQPQNSASVLSFIADIKRGKKAAKHIEDVHQLRLLYNRHLQWQYANARTDAALRSQKVKAEKMLHSVWRTIADLWVSVMEKRVALQLLKLKFNLYSVLNNQLTCLNEWALIERDHDFSLTRAIRDLQSSTIRIPLTGGARGDVETVKAAVLSAVDVIQGMGSSLFAIRSQVEEMNCLVSELAELTARERAMLDECELSLGSTAALEVEEYSLRTHLLQTKRCWRNGEQFFAC